MAIFFICCDLAGDGGSPQCTLHSTEIDTVWVALNPHNYGTAYLLDYPAGETDHDITLPCRRIYSFLTFDSHFLLLSPRVHLSPPSYKRASLSALACIVGENRRLPSVPIYSLCMQDGRHSYCCMFDFAANDIASFPL